MTKRPVVLATNPMHPEAEARLAEHAELVVAPDAEPDTLRRLAAEAVGIIVRAMLPEDILEHAPRLRGIVRHGVGLDFIPVSAATARGVSVANLPGINAQAVAEYGLGAMFALRRSLTELDSMVRRQGWAAAKEAAGRTTELGGTTLGIVGVGTIGGRLAAMARDGLGMKVIGCSSRPGRVPQGVEEVELDALFARADVVVLTCALTEQTRGMVDRRRLALMKPDAMLINVSRGAVVDTQALVDALKRGALRGAALDVHEQQPIPEDSPVLDCPRLLITPHIAAITETSVRAMGLGAVEEMIRILHGHEPEHLVNPEYRSHRTGVQ